MIVVARALSPIALVLIVSGCFSPYIRQAGGTPEQKPTDALVAGFVVRMGDAGGEKSLAGAMVEAAMNSGLEEFGKRATELLAGRLAAFGYAATYDQARSAKLDAVQISSNQATAALTGQWRHPDASYWVPQTVDSLFVKPNDIIQKLNQGSHEYFAFADVTVTPTGMFFKEPFAVVKVAIYDENARKVLDLAGGGKGDSSFLFVDKSPGNLERALTRAFASLETVAPQPL